MIVTDIDGTIADHKHREHLLTPVLNVANCIEMKCPYLRAVDCKCFRPAQCKHKTIEQEQWDKFLDPEQLMKDGVIQFSREVIEAAAMFHTIVFMTGRNENTREATILWLKEVFEFPHSINLYMRSGSDRGPALQLKDSLLAKIKMEHFQAVAVERLYAFEDDTEVFEAYHQHGFTTYQAPACWEELRQSMGLFT